jgi:hypothetical protein
VVVRGLRGDAQRLGDLLGRLALGDQVEDLALAGGEVFVGVVGGARGAAVLLGEGLGRLEAEPGLAGGDGADGFEELGGGAVLDQVATVLMKPLFASGERCLSMSRNSSK